MITWEVHLHSAFVSQVEPERISLRLLLQKGRDTDICSWKTASNAIKERDHTETTFGTASITCRLWSLSLSLITSWHNLPRFQYTIPTLSLLTSLWSFEIMSVIQMKYTSKLHLSLDLCRQRYNQKCLSLDIIIHPSNPPLPLKGEKRHVEPVYRSKIKVTKTFQRQNRRQMYSKNVYRKERRGNWSNMILKWYSNKKREKEKYKKRFEWKRKKSWWKRRRPSSSSDSLCFTTTSFHSFVRRTSSSFCPFFPLFSTPSNQMQVVVGIISFSTSLYAKVTKNEWKKIPSDCNFHVLLSSLFGTITGKKTTQTYVCSPMHILYNSQDFLAKWEEDMTGRRWRSTWMTYNTFESRKTMSVLLFFIWLDLYTFSMWIISMMMEKTTKCM